MDHKLRLYHVGPIQECDLDLNDFTVLTGPQSSGKSTVAKAVFFQDGQTGYFEYYHAGRPASSIGPG